MTLHNQKFSCDINPQKRISVDKLSGKCDLSGVIGFGVAAIKRDVGGN